MTPVTLPAADFAAVLREGCALVLAREWVGADGLRRRACTPLTALGPVVALPSGPSVETEAGPCVLDSLAIDLTRASGQWAVVMWTHALPNHVRASVSRDDRDNVILPGIFGKAGPAELRRVALAVRGATGT